VYFDTCAGNDEWLLLTIYCCAQVSMVIIVFCEVCPLWWSKVNSLPSIHYLYYDAFCPGRANVQCFEHGNNQLSVEDANLYIVKCSYEDNTFIEENTLQLLLNDLYDFNCYLHREFEYCRSLLLSWLLSFIPYSCVCVSLDIRTRALSAVLDLWMHHHSRAMISTMLRLEKWIPVDSNPTIPKNLHGCMTQLIFSHHDIFRK